MLLKTHYTILFSIKYITSWEKTERLLRGGEISNQYHGFQGQERIQMIAQKNKTRKSYDHAT